MLARGRDFVRPAIPKRWRGLPTVPVVRLTGVIGFSTPLRPGMTLSGLARALDRAFATKPKAVALVINSPGGSAVQSHLIYRRIRQLSQEKSVPVIAFVEDVAASGGYMIACAADEIVCDPSSIVGSIGVVGASFGASEALKKLGIERRVHTAGEKKVMLDPFLPEKPEDVVWLRGLQDQLHEMFRAWVVARRGDRLASDVELFNGEVWTGARAAEMGLVDGLGTARGVLTERFPDAELVPIEGRRPLLARLGIGAAPAALKHAPADLVAQFAQAAEIRATWARYGL
jgi:signal peptide peptidase SppA